MFKFLVLDQKMMQWRATRQAQTMRLMKTARMPSSHVPIFSVMTPHDVDAHFVPSNAWFTSAVTHQPRSWLNFLAEKNISRIFVTPEVSHALMSLLNE